MRCMLDVVNIIKRKIVHILAFKHILSHKNTDVVVARVVNETIIAAVAVDAAIAVAIATIESFIRSEAKQSKYKQTCMKNEKRKRKTTKK